MKANYCEQEVKEMKEELLEEKKKNPIKGLLTFVMIIAIAAAAFIGIKKGAAYVAHKQDPEFNNLVKLKYEEVINLDFMVTDMVVGVLGEKGHELSAKYLYPLMEKLFVNEEAAVIENDELNTLLADPWGTYTLEDEEYLMGYQGRKVKLTGTIYQIQEGTAYFCTGVEYDSSSKADIPIGRSISLNVNYLADQSLIYENSVIELEGFLTVGLYPSGYEDSEWRFDHYVFVKEVKEADFVALGGNPAELYMHQKADTDIHIEQDEFIIDISAAIVDAKTGDAVVRFTYAKDAERYYGMTDDDICERPQIVGIKGKNVGVADGSLILDGRTEDVCVVIDNISNWNEEHAISMGNLHEQVGISDEVISLYIVGYYEPHAEVGETITFTDADVTHAYTVQIDIPSSEWTLYE